MVTYGCEKSRRIQLDLPESTSNPAKQVDLSTSAGACTYINIFSSQRECRSYLGDQWTIEEAETDCLSQQDSSFVGSQACELDTELGQCLMEEEDQVSYILHFPGDDPEAKPDNRWRSHGHLLYGNWINSIYQSTPYDIGEIGT